MTWLLCKFCGKLKKPWNFGEPEYNENLNALEEICHACSSLYERSFASDRRA